MLAMRNRHHEVTSKEAMQFLPTSQAAHHETLETSPFLSKQSKHLAEGRTFSHILLEICGFVLFFSWMVKIALSLYDRFIENGDGRIMVYRMIVVGIFGIAAADFTSGTLHWMVDNYGDPDYPVLGSVFFRPFHHHHSDPQAITMHGFVERNGNNFFVCLPPLWAAHSAFTDHNDQTSFLMATFWLVFALFAGFANETHVWAHMKSPPRVVKHLQDLGLLVSRQAHHEHHIRPHDRNYCLVTGWLNRPLTAIRFFEAIESIIAKITGIIPLHERIRAV
ncbi:hypothetical protein VTL71DRAFT_9872 [Oculimacula yallundae]|uniref:Lipid desaturase domain-containing protein n=1 Tax=Oculimacula yallundae TaxID=86028 RepID=A0ABR4BQS8_9HELO